MQSKSKLNIALLLALLTGVVVLVVLDKKREVAEVTSPLEEPAKDSILYTDLYKEFFNFENIDLGITASNKAFSGKSSTKLTPDIEYGFGINKTINELLELKNTEKVNIELMANSPIADSSVVFVFSVSNAKNPNVYWEGKTLVVKHANEWQKFSFSFNIRPDLLNAENTFHFYLWNKGKKELHVDDLHFSLYGKMIVKDESLSTFATNYFFDLETQDGITGVENLKEGPAHSGKIVCDLSDGKEYGISIIKAIKDISETPLTKIGASVWFYPLEDNVNVVLTASVSNNKGETVFWAGESTELSPFPKNKWTKLNMLYNLPADKITPEDKIMINIWNKGKNRVLVDDLEIVYGDQPERKGISSNIDPTTFYEGGFVAQKNKPPFPFVYFLYKDIPMDPAVNLYSGGDEFFAGDFIKDQDGLDELLCVGNSGASLFGFDPQKKLFKKLSQFDSKDIVVKELCSSENKLFVADFDKDSKSEILVINRMTGVVKCYSLLNGRFESLGQYQPVGRDILNELDRISITSAFSESGVPLFVWFDKEKIKTGKLLNNKFEFKDILISSPENQIFSVNDKVISFSNTTNGNVILKYNTDWRFDLKMINVLKNDYLITGMVDFRGYKNDQNPKFYELTKLVSGKFLRGDKTSVIVISCNCKDVDFDGRSCKQLETIKGLPNTIALYELN